MNNIIELKKNNNGIYGVCVDITFPLVWACDYKTEQEILAVIESHNETHKDFPPIIFTHYRNLAGELVKFLLLIAFVFTAAANAQQVKLENAADFRTTYTDQQPTDQVLFWRGMMPAAVSSEAAEQVFKALPAAWLKRRASVEKETEFSKRIEPITKLYNRNYKIVLVEFDKPFLMIDSDAVLILTTELLKNISDDELFGLIAHEAAHSIFREKSQQLKAAKPTKEVLNYLALIEISCDAIAARTMLAINRPPLAFLEFVKKIEANYSEEKENGLNYHPTARERIKIIKQLTN